MVELCEAEIVDGQPACPNCCLNRHYNTLRLLVEKPDGTSLYRCRWCGAMLKKNGEDKYE